MLRAGAAHCTGLGRASGLTGSVRVKGATPPTPSTPWQASQPKWGSRGVGGLPGATWKSSSPRLTARSAKYWVPRSKPAPSWRKGSRSQYRGRPMAEMVRVANAHQRYLVSRCVSSPSSSK